MALHPSTRQYVSSPDIADNYDAYFADSPLFDFDQQMLDSWLDTPGCVLDLGCGTGRHLLSLAERGFAVTGVDLSEHMLAVAARKLDQSGYDAQLVRADLTQIRPDRASGLGQSRFDAVICMFSTLGLIRRPAHRLRLLLRTAQWLRPGGQFICHVHNYHYNIWSHEGRVFLLTNLIRAALGRDELGDKYLSTYRGIERMYIHVFARAEILGLLTRAGLTPIEIIPLNRSRTGRLRCHWLEEFRANGYLIRSKKR